VVAPFARDRERDQQNQLNVATNGTVQEEINTKVDSATGKSRGLLARRKGKSQEKVARLSFCFFLKTGVPTILNFLLPPRFTFFLRVRRKKVRNTTARF